MAGGLEKEGQPLREGFTTGTAAAAAAHAAVAALLGGRRLASVSVPLPPFAGERLEIPIARVRTGGRGKFPWAMASVIKDGGDDPDVTHGLRLDVQAGLDIRALSGTARADAPPVLIGGFSSPVFIHAGWGVGRVTLPGLPVPPGEPAINPEPRRQIAAAACEAAAAQGRRAALHLLIRVPMGEARAGLTLNPRLGIVGGISILGTRGIVRPYSNEAWQAVIAQGIDLAAAAGISSLLFSTGRRSEQFLQRLYPCLPPLAAVQVADFAAFSLRLALKNPGIRRVAWGCFPGKLLKLAQGLEWTHARSAPADLPGLVRLWRERGGPEAPALAAMPTAAGALSLMREISPEKHGLLLRALAAQALTVMLGWLRAEPEGRTCSELSLHVFSPEGETLASAHAPAA
jgi:cobalt-precorrin-5B (C1)-methyltransferase